MTRREFLIRVTPTQLTVPVVLLLDRRAKPGSVYVRRFSSEIWPEAVRDFHHGGISLQTRTTPGEVRRAPSDTPVINGLVRGAVNVVLTDFIPVAWDRGRRLAGVTTLHEGFHVCMIALQEAHPHRVPFIAVNTCVHEILHALLQDIFEVRPKGITGQTREVRIDFYATRLWLFHDGSAIRESAKTYLARLRSGVASSA